jgi:phosphate transport system substrate-binding protein
MLLLSLVACNASSGVTSSNESQAASHTSNAYVSNTGSDTIVNLALAWAEKYQEIHPEVRISVSGGGSGTGIASLINRTVDIANASREIKEEELDQAQKNGVEPKEFVVAGDAIAVIINPENPIEQLTIQQISDIFSGKYQNWRELGGENRPIVRVSRETNSGTHVYFLERVLRLGEEENNTLFATDTLLLPSSQGIISEVGDNPNAIGYDGLGYVTPEVKVLAIAKDTAGPFVLPSIQTVDDGSYPISRDLFMYTIGEPTGAIKDYMDWIYEPVAQQIVGDLGFVPIHK